MTEALAIRHHSPVVPLLGPAAVFGFTAILWILLVHRDGGWLEVDRSRRGLPTREGTTPWEELTPTARMWVRLVPYLLIGMVVLVAAAVVIEM